MPCNIHLLCTIIKKRNFILCASAILQNFIIRRGGEIRENLQKSGYFVATAHATFSNFSLFKAFLRRSVFLTLANQTSRKSEIRAIYYRLKIYAEDYTNWINLLKVDELFWNGKTRIPIIISLRIERTTNESSSSPSLYLSNLVLPHHLLLSQQPLIETKLEPLPIDRFCILSTDKISFPSSLPTFSYDEVLNE